MFNESGKMKFVKKAKTSLLDSWKVLIVDDEEGVHAITKAVLDGFSFENKKLEFISAYSAKEAYVVMSQHKDISLILLDVVMEEDDSGLKFAKIVRDVIKNKFVRIVLRTGQPGQAPEKDVIMQYDINDYKEKTELTSDKLFTTVVASIRNYRDLMQVEEKKEIIEQNRIGLKNIINSSASLFEIHSLKDFASSALVQLVSLLKLNSSKVVSHTDGFTACKNSKTDEFTCLAGTGKFSKLEGKLDVDPKIIKQLKIAEDENKSYFDGDAFIGYYKTQTEMKNFIYMTGCSNLGEDEKRLIDIFSTNISIAFDNIYLDQEVAETQAEIIYTLGEVMENRSKETASHVKRVANYTHMIAKKYGFNEEEAFILKSASPLHDIGKIGIEDSILLKPGKLTEDEFTVMKTHSKIGYEILKKSTRSVLKAAAIVAHEHHEKFDGTGYPNGKKGSNIHIYGRMVAIADVFDALTHKRVYKSAWTFDEAIDFIKSQKGLHFDPNLVDVFLENMKEIKEIHNIQ